MGAFWQLLLTIGAAFLGAWLALMRFRTERWWEFKAESYLDLVEALHEMSMVPAEYINAGASGQNLSKEQQAILWESFRRAKRKVWKIADSVDFVISSDVANVILEMNRGLSKADDNRDLYEHLEETEKAVNECLKNVKAIGAKELGVKKGKGLNGYIPEKLKGFIQGLNLGNDGQKNDK